VALFHPLFAQLSDDLWIIFNAQGNILEVNSRCQNILGWTKQEMVTLSIPDLVHDDDADYVQGIMKNIKEQTTLGQGEARWRCKDGTYRDLNWNFVFSTADQLLYAIAHDVTLPKRDLTLLKQIQRVARIGGWEMNLISGDIYWTDELYEIFEVNPAEFHPDKKSIFRFYPEESAALIREGTRQVLENGKTFDAEILSHTASGKAIVTRVSTEPVMSQGRVVGAIGIVQDITSIKAAQEKIWSLNEMNRAIIEGASYAVVSTDLTGNVLGFNPAAEELLGYKAEECVGKMNVKSFHWDEQVQKIRDNLGQDAPDEDFNVFIGINKEHGRNENEWTLVCKDGRKLFCSIAFSTVVNNKGELIGYVGMIKDVTELKRYQAELIQAKEEAMAATKAKTDFLANISHEIRTPMNSIMGMGELLGESQLDEDQHQYISILNRATSSLLQIINDVLDISRIESGQLEIESIPYNLRDVLDNSVELFLHKAREKNLSLRLEVSSAVPQEIVGDPHRIRQVLINLIGNSMKFTEQGGVSIFVDSARGKLNFRIEDTGIGMSEEQIEKLFHRFSQTDSSIARKYGGSGLGLSISYQLVECMGGTMNVESSLGHGTVFTFEIPLVELNKSPGQSAPILSPEL
jgi:PAS domain S-box-containing protein